MKIKNLFTSIEFTLEELNDISYKTPVYARVGLWIWIKEKFGLDMLPKPKFSGIDDRKKKK